MDTSFANIYIRDTHERVYVLVLAKKRKKKKKTDISDFII